MKKIKDEHKVLVAVNIDDDIYFKLLEICLKERKTLDQVVNEILTEQIKRLKKRKKGVKK